jgi:DNA mismatch endonuclease, patch repair protein
VSARSKAPRASSAAVTRRMQATKRKDTPGELALRAELRTLGLRYRLEYPLAGTRRRADVAVPGVRLAVFVDGCFWHGCPQHGTWPKANAAWWRAKIGANQRRDRDTDSTLRDAGWMVLRFWEHDDPAVAARKVMSSVRARARRAKPTNVTSSHQDD